MCFQRNSRVTEHWGEGELMKTSEENKETDETLGKKESRYHEALKNRNSRTVLSDTKRKIRACVEGRE